MKLNVSRSRYKGLNQIPGNSRNIISSATQMGSALVLRLGVSISHISTSSVEPIQSYVQTMQAIKYSTNPLTK